MTDNFDLFKKYIREAGIPESKHYLNDLFFTIQLIRRGKDCPDLPAANYTFKTYYIDNMEEYARAREEIIEICKIFPFRAYISVNCKSKTRSQSRVLIKIAQAIEMGETKKPWRMFNAACDEVANRNDKRWIVDVDSSDYRVVEPMRILVVSCASKYDANEIILMQVPTKSGFHLITRPFNIEQFKNKFEMMREQMILKIECPDIKKNHLTLLYENLP